jgi:biotin transport system substrate-specific component
MAAAVAVLHLGGWSWLAAVIGLGPAQAFATGVAPFLLGDLVKLALAATALPMAQRAAERRAGPPSRSGRAADPSTGTPRLR